MMEKPNSNSWNKNKAMGNIAENIIEFLLNSMQDKGWSCVKYGMENHIDALKHSIRDNNTPMSRRIRTMPDYIAINEKTNQVILIDGKYRAFIDRRKGGIALYGFKYGQMKDYLEFWRDITFIVVHPHPPYFYVIDLKDVEWHKHFHSKTGENSTLMELWNFIGIEKDIKTLFPELDDKTLKDAINLIPKSEEKQD